jgi:hypothetical protein
MTKVTKGALTDAPTPSLVTKANSEFQQQMPRSVFLAAHASQKLMRNLPTQEAVTSRSGWCQGPHSLDRYSEKEFSVF